MVLNKDGGALEAIDSYLSDNENVLLSSRKT